MNDIQIGLHQSKLIGQSIYDVWNLCWSYFNLICCFQYIWLGWTFLGWMNANQSLFKFAGSYTVSPVKCCCHENVVHKSLLQAGCDSVEAWNNNACTAWSFLSVWQWVNDFLILCLTNVSESVSETVSASWWEQSGGLFWWDFKQILLCESMYFYCITRDF